MLRGLSPSSLRRHTSSKIPVRIRQDNVRQDVPRILRNSVLYTPDDGYAFFHSWVAIWMAGVPGIQLSVFLDGFELGATASEQVFSVFACVREYGMYALVAWARYHPPKNRLLFCSVTNVCKTALCVRNAYYQKLRRHGTILNSCRRYPSM